MNIRRILESKVLPLVTKPGRYIGGEVGAVLSPPRQGDVRIALAFPDVYEIGMSHLGFRILYALINKEPGLRAERVFAPWPDMEERLRECGLPLYSLETFTPLREFDVIGFSLQYELTYTNILTMLDLAGIPLKTAERAGGDYPLVIAGGPCASVPGPLEDFIDVFLIGDGEESLVELMRCIERGGARGAERAAEIARSVKGAFVPQLYEEIRASDGTVTGMRPRERGVPERVVRRVVPELESSRWLGSIPVPSIGIIHDRCAFEVRRGCSHGCRFCQAGVLYRPVRDEDPARIADAAVAGLRSTGYDEVALCALSVGDYPALEAVAERIRAAAPAPLSLSLPSLRPDRLEAPLAGGMPGGRKTGVTLAPEAGTESLRKRINKEIALDDLIGFVRRLRRRGWRTVKLYFMVGLPGETDEDLRGIVDIIRQVADIRKEGKGRWDVNVTISSFIPKAHTPFQWEPMDGSESIKRKQDFIRRGIKRRNVRLRFNDIEASLLEAAFSRGERRLGEILQAAWRLGCRFDGWSETFRPDLWRKAFGEAGLDLEAFATREIGEGEFLPWDVIDTGMARAFLLSEREKSRRGEYTEDCIEAGCRGCGVCDSIGVKPRVARNRSV